MSAHDPAIFLAAGASPEMARALALQADRAMLVARLREEGLPVPKLLDERPPPDPRSALRAKREKIAAELAELDALLAAASHRDWRARPPPAPLPLSRTSLSQLLWESIFRRWSIRDGSVAPGSRTIPHFSTARVEIDLGEIR